MNLDVSLINYSSQGQKDQYSLYSRRKNIKSIIKNVLIFLFKEVFEKRRNDFIMSIDRLFTQKVDGIDGVDDFERISTRYDYLVTGGDQIWNRSCPDFNDIYFLPFSSTAKKVSYAPSFGGRSIFNKNENLELYRNCLKDYDSLSIRERNGQRWIEDLTGIEAKIVADPTLMVNKSIFYELANRKVSLDKYIFFYGVPFDRSFFSAVDYISKKYDLPVVVLDPKIWIFGFGFVRGFKLAEESTPEMYLSLIKNAEFVITTSFHGSIFSQIFKKKFWYLTFRGTNNDDDRLKCLFDQMGINDRVIFTNEVNNVDFLKPIDSDKIDLNLQKLIFESQEYLKKAFEN